MNHKMTNVAGYAVGFLILMFYIISFPFALISARLYQNSYCKKKYGRGIWMWYGLPEEERREITKEAIMYFYGDKIGGFFWNRC